MTGHARDNPQLRRREVGALQGRSHQGVETMR